MKKKALALGITMALALPGMASAAIMDYGYDGGKLSSKDGPGYQPQQTIDDVQASAAVQERSRRLQDQPDAQTEKVTLAGQETVTEQKEREERGEKVASESTLPRMVSRAFFSSSFVRVMVCSLTATCIIIREL